MWLRSLFQKAKSWVGNWLSKVGDFVKDVGAWTGLAGWVAWTSAALLSALWVSTWWLAPVWLGVLGTGITLAGSGAITKLLWNKMT